MRRLRLVASWLAGSLAVLSLVVLLSATQSLAQEKPRRAAAPAKAAGKAAPDKQPADAAPEKAKSGGRLPAHFAGVVTPEQREKILAIQSEYAGKIKALQAELKALTDKRDAAMNDLLTADQRQKVDAAKAKAAAAKAAKAAAAKAAAVPEPAPADKPKSDK